MSSQQPAKKEIRAEIDRRKRLWYKLQAEARRAVSIAITLAKQRGVSPRELSMRKQSGYIVCYRLTGDEGDRRRGMAQLRSGRLVTFHPDPDPAYQNYPDLNEDVLEGFLEHEIRLVLISLGIDDSDVEIIT